MNRHSLLGVLLFSEVCLLAGVGGILAFRHPWPGLFLLCAVIALDLPRSARPARLVCLLCVFTAAFLYTDFREPAPPRPPNWLERAASLVEDGKGELRPAGPVEVRAKVAEAQPLPGGRARLLLEEMRPAGGGEAYAGRVALSWTFAAGGGGRDAGKEGAALPVPGEEVEAKLRLRPQRGLRNPGVWDIDAFWQARGVFYRASARGQEAVRPVAPDGVGGEALSSSLREQLRIASGRAREELRKRFSAALPEEGAGAALLPALVFGDRSGISPELADRFARATLAHSLALSGLHLGFALLCGGALAYGGARLLRRWAPRFLESLPRPRLALWLALPFAAAQLWLGGFPVSLVRAACMLAFAALLASFARGRVVLDSLFAALAVILLVQPLALFEVSLQLSALSVGVIALLLPRLTAFGSKLFPAGKGGPRRGTRLARACLVLLGISFGIQVALLPVTADVFGASGLMFPLNLVWLPVLGTLVMPLAFAGLCAAALGLPLPAALCLRAAALPCEALDALLLSLDAAGVLFAPLLPRPHWLCPAGFWLLFPALGALAGGRRRGLVCLAVAVALMAAPVASVLSGTSEKAVRLTLIDVGQGQAALVEWSGLDGGAPGRVLIDGGGSSSPFFDIGKSIMAPVLTRMALPRLDAVVNSHPDADHLGGLLFILERFAVGRYLVNGDSAAPGLAEREARALARAGLRPETLIAGDRVPLAPGLLLECLWPPPAFPRPDAAGKAEGGNNASLMLRLVWEGRPLALVCGDVERRAIAALLREGGDLSAPVLVLPHHGSARSLVPGFYECVRPEIALAASAFGNWYGFPSRAVRDALAALGVPLMSTAEGGQIQVEWRRPDNKPLASYAALRQTPETCRRGAPVPHKETSMKKFRIKGLENAKDCRSLISNCVETVDGLEMAHINMETGEITYSQGVCDENALRAAFADKGLELEEKEE